MKKQKNTFKNMTLAQLKEEYVQLGLGALIFNANTTVKRRRIADEIDRREGREPFDWSKAGNEEYIMQYDLRNMT